MPTQEVVKETFEVVEHVQAEKADAPSSDELKAGGWSAGEIASAEKRGLIPKQEDVKKAEEVKAGEPDTKKEEPVVTTETKAEEKPKSTLPDFTFKTPEQEKVFLEAFGPGTPQRAMYFRMKNERQARQTAENERDQARKDREALEARIQILEKGIKKEVDEFGNEIDPDDKPLTVRQLKELQKAEAEAIEKNRSEQTERVRIVSEAQQVQEEYAKSIYEDFDDTVIKAQEVIKNLDSLIPEKYKQAKAIKLIRDLQVAAANADKLDLDEYNAAHIAYEIGQMHPKYGQKAEPSNNGDVSDKDGNSKDPKKANGGRLTPDQMKRIEENTQRRASSASVSGGGGTRTISADDVGVAELNKMSYAERQRFREKHPARYAQLLRA